MFFLLNKPKFPPGMLQNYMKRLSRKAEDVKAAKEGDNTISMSMVLGWDSRKAHIDGDGPQTATYL